MASVPLKLKFIVVAILCTYPTSAEQGVGILSKNNQILTSSTLYWVASNGNQEQKLPGSKVVGGTELIIEPGEENEDKVSTQPIYICRARQNGMWIPGQLRPGKTVCTVSMHHFVHLSKQFEVLYNLEDGAKLRWVSWSKYFLIPDGAVTGGESYRTYIGRWPVKTSTGKESTYSHFIGKLDPDDGLGSLTVVNDNDEEETHSEGEVLVESEPISYEMTKVEFDLKKIRVNKQPHVLGQIILKNENVDDAGLVASVITYNYNYSLYWGHGHAVLTGFPVSVVLKNGTQLEDFKWGLSYEKEKRELQQVEVYLLPGTAVNVTLWGNYTETDLPYIADLTAIYGDNSRMQRVIKDNRHEVSMNDVHIQLSYHYYLHNNTVVPFTTSTTTSTIPPTVTSTISTTTTTTTTAAPSALLNTKNEVFTTPLNNQTYNKPKKIEQTTQNNSTGNSNEMALTLKNKDENSVSSNVNANTVLLILGIITLIRIT